MKPTTILLGLVAAMIASPAIAHAQFCDLGLVAQDESGGRNVPNFKYGDGRHTAGGYWQITDTNWRAYAPLVDIDIQKRPNALSATPDEQGQVAGIMRAKLGCLPWVPYNARLRADLASLRDGPKQQKGGNPANPIFPKQKAGLAAATRPATNPFAHPARTGREIVFALSTRE